MIITDQMVDATATAIEAGYVERGIFANDEFRAVTDDDKFVARKALEAAMAVLQAG